MLTKEECIKALEIVCGCMEVDADSYVEVLEQLIEEYFELLRFYKSLESRYKNLCRENRKLKKALYFKENQYVNLNMKLRYYVDKYVKCKEELKSNSPLKFEELKEGMWVWDNLFKRYNKIVETSVHMFETTYLITFEYVHEPTRWKTIKFEENRFYRKEVKE